MSWHPLGVLIFQVTLSLVDGKTPEQCIFVMKEDYAECGNRKDELATFRGMSKNRLYKLENKDNTSSDCTSIGGCRPLYTISRIRRQSFSTKTQVQISNLLHRCCGSCTKYYRMDLHEPLSQKNISFLQQSDIIYPVPSRSSLVTELHGFHYIPVFNIPSAYYFTIRKSDKQMTMKMIMDCLDMWPLLVICMLMAIIAGFIGWLIETWANEDEFPRPFIKGLIDGFWWSFISMTTVGYGDKAPKSLPARIFSVLWILTGITMTSIYIAALANAIMNGMTHTDPEITGRNVGTLKNQLHDSTMVSQHGGSLHVLDFNDTVIGIVELILKLEKEEIDGFLVTRPIYYYFARSVKEKKKYEKYNEKIKHISLLRTEKFFRMEQPVSGMLLKHQDDFKYFKKYFDSNWLQIQGCYSINLNYKDKKFEVHYHSPIAGMFYPFLTATLTIIGAILIFGLVYELIRYHRRRGRGKRNGMELQALHE